jgi:DNA-binding NtrC family response regulator
MQNSPIILVADRNPHIRKFVARELEADGYCVQTAANVSQLRQWISPSNMPDVLILDPDLPEGGAQDYIWPLLERHPELPVIFHCLSSDIPMPMPQMACTVIVGKSANSIDLLKRQIDLLLKTVHQD